DAVVAVHDLEQTNDACPTLARDGRTTTIRGGCTTEAGVTINGTATDGPTLHFDRLAVASQGAETTYSGDATVAGSLGAVIVGAEADLTVERGGIAVRSDLSFHCRSDPYCDNFCVLACEPEGSGLELVGAGGVRISGQWNLRYPGGALFVDG